MRHAPLIPPEFGSDRPNNIFGLLGYGLYHSRRMRAERTLLRYAEKIAQARRNISRELNEMHQPQAHEVSKDLLGGRGPAPGAVRTESLLTATVALTFVCLMLAANWRGASFFEVIQREKINLLGYLAASLVLTTFCMRSMSGLRAAALASNLAFIGYGYFAHLLPVLVLHAILLPINSYRLLQLWGVAFEKASKCE